MNLSGAALRPLLGRKGFDPAQSLLVLTDDFALPLGTFRLRAMGSAGGHRGLKSVESVLGSKDYARLRIGVGPLPAGLDGWSDFVLARFSREESRELEELMPTMVDAVECWVAEGIERAMAKFNKGAKG
jgi:peptidyl-tRNA hydrolase, PTH1 family